MSLCRSAVVSSLTSRSAWTVRDGCGWSWRSITLPMNLLTITGRTTPHPQPFSPLRGEGRMMRSDPDVIAPCGESGRGLPQSKTLSRLSGPPPCPPGFGLRQSSGALATGLRWTTGEALFRFRGSKRRKAGRTPNASRRARASAHAERLECVELAPAFAHGFRGREVGSAPH
jgi:hypothetical protein